jgi:hypothetical protein
MLLAEIKKYTIPYMYYASVTISIVHIIVAIHFRQCKNLSVHVDTSLQHNIHALLPTHILINQTNERIAL